MKKAIVMCLSISLATVACSTKEEPKEEKGRIPVSLTEAVVMDYQPERSYPGGVRPFREASLGATLPGKIEKMYVSEGVQVQQGSLLAELSGELLTQAVVENSALQKDFERIARLHEKGSVSTIEYDHLKARLEASEARVALVRKNTQVVAPFSGTVVEIAVNEGENYSLLPSVDAQNLSVKNGILTLMQLNRVKVVIEVNEKELPLVKTGQSATISCDAIPGGVREGKICYVKPFLSPATRTASVEIELANGDGVFKPGMFVTALLKGASERGVFIPIGSLYRQPGTSNDFVFTVEKGKAKRIPVTRLQTLNNLVCVAGIDPGARVVTAGKTRLAEGIEVEVK